MPIDQSVLAGKAAAYQDVLQEGMKKSASLGTTRSAFLCHSHKDETLVKGLLTLFNEAGIDLYIDWKDHSMPETPNAATAKTIQDAIKDRTVFMFLATANAKASRWCPWEIGYADSNSRKIFIVPTEDGAGTYGNEYLQLYSRIDLGSHEKRTGLAVFRAGMAKGEWLSAALLR
ncbi:MAG: toll/interleukin-1 receptor domain-containing protein [Acidobacteria bacterium]|nr:toll/interleukin-1 receptor domain-containing protein [Acidobacteriota bacterium]